MRRAGALAIAAVLLLSGCVGIPTSGGVDAGPEFDEQAQPDVEVVAEGPVAGSDQRRILADFMQAVRSSRGDFATAREFMTPGLAERWKPNAGVIVRTSANATQSSTAADTWDYTVAATATVNAEGVYSEAATTTTQTLTFAFQQVGGEWRISEAADGIVLSEPSFDIVFTQQPLYFFDSTHRFLVPDVRWFAARTTTPTRAVRELIAGPTEWLAQGVLQTAFPPATELGAEGVDVSGSTATVDLSAQALASSEQDRDWMRQQLAATLGATDVTITIDGRTLAVPPPAGVPALVNPLVENGNLVLGDTGYGIDTGSGITPLPGISAVLADSGADALTLARDRSVAAFRGADGRVGAATATGDAIVLDDRPGLAAPALDPFGLIWSVPVDDAAALIVTDLDGNAQSVGQLPAGADVASIDVSRDGTRLLVALSGGGGPALLVAGIVRQGDGRIALGPTLELPIGVTPAVDAAWVSDRAVAALGSGGQVTAYELGGPRTQLGVVAGATAIVGGNGGTDGLRVLSEGEVLRPQGTSGWVSTGILSSLLGTKQ
ncbi:MAG TPA: GerMN domain-containing protein [Rhodoglobus sp.]|nr:GerMN domain-containing protein [Rhodoglobus sp.]